jgi:3-(3-hydroxy-phenyl)propionate hydroxylase
VARPFDCDVLIVGAGPVGATLALMLARSGLEVIAADMAQDIYPLPRAAHIDHETVRIFQSVGAAEGIMASSRVAARYDFLSAAGEVLMRFDTTGVTSPSGWPPSNMIHQPSLERTVRDRLERTAGAALHGGWTLLGLEQDGEAVTARFSTPEGEQAIVARYLVGCDGARSATRALAGIALDDLKFDEPWLVVDTLVTDPARLPQINLQICDPARPTTCVLMGAGRHRWEFMLLPGETAEQVSADAFIAALLKPWKVDGAVTFERAAVYRFHALVARRWREGRVLLAGDAAHQTPPFAGQGLCAGIRDAANLAWKLAAVITGEASERLLDSYQQEREPHVRTLIDLALMMGRTVCITDPAAAAARDAAMLAARRADGRPPAAPGAPPLAAGLLSPGSTSAGEAFPQPWTAAGERLDDCLGPGAWLIYRGGASPPTAATAFALESPALAPFARDIGAWLDSRGAQAVLVRPDRYVFGTGDAESLARAWSAALAAERGADA